MERRIAFISGASRGIGAAASLALAERGFDCVITARTVSGGEVHDYGVTRSSAMRMAMPGSLEETAAGIRERGREALVIPMDLLDRASVESAADRALAEWGHVDVLLNNALYQGPGTMDRLLDLDLDDVERLLRGNLVHQLLMVQKILPRMLERGSGTIINMVSAAGMGDPPAPPDSGGWGFAYGASKAALIRMSGVVPVEHPKSGVRFFSAEPGLIITESMKAQGLDGVLAEKMGGAPPVVAGAALAWLATEPEADGMQGEVVALQRLCRDRKLVPGWP